MTDTAPTLTAEEETRLAEMLAELHASGYQDVQEHGTLRPGVRIRHRGHQWPAAVEHGTGIVVAITEKPDSSWSKSWHMPDVELITVSDKATFGSRLSQLAQYHVSVIAGAR